MNEALIRLEEVTHTVTRWIAFVGLLCLVALALATIADVMMRWLFNSPIHGVNDLYNLVIAVVVGAFFPITLMQRHHISIRFLGTALRGRAYDWLNTFSNVALLVFLALMSWQLIKYVSEVRETGETTWILQWSVAPWWAVATAFVTLCVPIQLIVTLRDALEPRAAGGHGH